LPLIGVAIGWSLNEIGAFTKRAIERKRTLGKAIAVLYFLYLEMVQLKTVQENFKNMTTDVKEWERLRKRSFEKYTLNDPEFLKKLEATADAVAEFYPLKAYELRELLSKYQFIKSKSLDALMPSEEAYVAVLSAYEAGFLVYQHKLERLLRFLIFRHSKVEWIRVRMHFWKLRSRVPKGDLVFYEQLRRPRKSAAQSVVSSVAEENKHAASAQGPKREGSNSEI
jgi:hypothetical protein